MMHYQIQATMAGLRRRYERIDHPEENINIEENTGNQIRNDTLRALDKNIADETERLARSEKMLGDYQEQLGKPFEHEARLKELVAKQAQLNAALDLDKGERQVAPEEAGEPEERDDTPAAERSASWQLRERSHRRQRAFKAPPLRPGL